MKTPELVLVRADEWEGLYVDGALVTEHHSVDPESILDRVGGKVIYLTPSQDKALCEVGSLPTALADLQAKLGV